MAYVVTDGRLFSHKTGVWLTLLGTAEFSCVVSRTDARSRCGRCCFRAMFLFASFREGMPPAGCPALLVLSWAANARRACPDAVISELKGRERNGVIAFSEKPQPALFRTNERLQVRT